VGAFTTEESSSSYSRRLMSEEHHKFVIMANNENVKESLTKLFSDAVKSIAAYHWKSDSPSPYQMSLQEPASAYMEGLQIFNCQLLLVITAIVVLVSWLLLATIETTVEFHNSWSATDFSHSNVLEICWTSVPALILLSVASPSFALLFSMDEVAQPNLTLKVFGHQWYWSYEMSDFNSCLSSKNLRYTSYMLTKDDFLEQEVPGLLRNLETTRRVVLPTNTHIRLLITSVDVLHSWAVPSLGIKVDACPGRLNLVSLFIKRCGLYYGQCSEICGINHGFMPITLVGLTRSQFYSLVFDNHEVSPSPTTPDYEIVRNADKAEEKQVLLATLDKVVFKNQKPQTCFDVEKQIRAALRDTTGAQLQLVLAGWSEEDFELLYSCKVYPKQHMQCADMFAELAHAHKSDNSSGQALADAIDKLPEELITACRFFYKK
jgi:cytochrome c oxidase subunit 2